jgi:hypothetical protein
MTIEEKAKAYDEALEKAKNALQTDLHESGVWAIRRIFPELKESEDERIRKWLIEMVEELRKANPTNAEHNGNCSEAIAYLEQQNEKKAIEDTVKNIIKNKEAATKFLKSAGIMDENGELAEMYRSEQQKPEEKLSKEEYVKKFKALCDAYEIKLPNREYDIYGLCGDLHKLFGDIQEPTEWNEEDKTVEQFAEEYVEGVKKCNDAPTWDLIHTAVCYGYELGKNARKEE